MGGLEEGGSWNRQRLKQTRTEEEPRYEVVRLWGSSSGYELMVTVCYFLRSGELRLTKQALIRSASILSMQHADSWEGQGNRAALREPTISLWPQRA